MSQKSIATIKRIFEIFEGSQGEIRPHFVLTGASGTGKSHTVSLLADAMDLPMVEVNAAGLTKEGTAGNSLSKALSPLVQYGGRPVICFVDEFDKLFVSGNSNSDLAHETTNGVQNEFLKALEGLANISADYGKYHNISTDKVLFVFAGAFNGEEDITIDKLREFGMKTEFLGRVGLTYGMSKPTLADLKAILNDSKLLARYLELVPTQSKKQVVDAIMLVVTENYEKNVLGVRMLNTLLHQYFIEGSLAPKEVAKKVFQRKLSMPA